MGFFQLRRARLRSLVEGLVQKVRVEATEGDTKDAAERFQDYGFAANPVDGQGLKIDVDGHTIVLRMDRLAERPQLAAYEVTVWHREGHGVTLKSGGLIEAEGVRMVLKMSEAVAIETPSLTHNGVNIGGTHTHRNVQPGSGSSGTPNG